MLGTHKKGKLAIILCLLQTCIVPFQEYVKAALLISGKESSVRDASEEKKNHKNT